MGIVCASYDLAFAESPVKMRRERMQGLCHMTIAQIPGTHAVLEHAAIVFFRVLHEAGILFSGKEIIFRDLPVAVHIFVCALVQFAELLYDFFLTGLGNIEFRDLAIGLLVLAKMIETGIAIASSPRGFRVYFRKVANHLGARA